MLRPLLSIALCSGLMLGSSALATQADPPSQPTLKTAEAPAAPRASLGRLVRKVVRKITGDDRDYALENWARGELNAVRFYIQRGEQRQAIQRIDTIIIQMEMRRQRRYRDMARQLRTAIQALRHRDYRTAQYQVDEVLVDLRNGGGNDTSPGIRQVIVELQDALSLLENNQPYYAAEYLDEAQRLLRYTRDPRLLRERDAIYRAGAFAQRGSSWQAARIVREVLYRLQQGGGPPPPPDRDRDQANRAEWRRDIRDLIDTVQDGNIQMARRDLETLMRDIRQDGYDWQHNQGYVQRLGFIAQNLYRGNERWVVGELRALRRELNY
jgi:hypothetical protein